MLHVINHICPDDEIDIRRRSRDGSNLVGIAPCELPSDHGAAFFARVGIDIVSKIAHCGRLLGDNHIAAEVAQCDAEEPAAGANLEAF